MKPGDLVEPDWSFRASVDVGNRRQLGLVLSYPAGQEDRGAICVKVNWLGYELEEYYSVQHLAIVSEGK